MVMVVALGDMAVMEAMHHLTIPLSMESMHLAVNMVASMADTLDLFTSDIQKTRMDIPQRATTTLTCLTADVRLSTITSLMSTAGMLRMSSMRRVMVAMHLSSMQLATAVMVVYTTKNTWKTGYFNFYNCLVP